MTMGRYTGAFSCPDHTRTVETSYQHALERVSMPARDFEILHLSVIPVGL